MGRSRGGLSTKIHALTSDEESLLGVALTGGETHDSKAFDALYGTTGAMPNVRTLCADKAYDSDRIRNTIAQGGHEAVIPSKANRCQPIDFDRNVYRERNRIERAFRKLKGFRRVATRFDKLANCFKAFVCFAASILLIRKIVNTP